MEEQKFNYYVVVTDINSRQYNFEIPEEGIQVTCFEQPSFIMNRNIKDLEYFISTIYNTDSFKIDNAVFNTEHIVTVQYIEIPVEAI